MTTVSSNGCESAKQYVEIIGESVETPNFREENEVLITADHGYNIQWLQDGEPIFAANESRYTPTQSGKYTVEYSSRTGNCKKAAPEINFRYDGIEEITSVELEDELVEPFFNIYPNPASTSLNLIGHSNDRSGIKFRIMDLRGLTKMMRDLDYNEYSQGVTIEFNGILSSGIYLVLIEQNDRIIQKKLFIR